MNESLSTVHYYSGLLSKRIVTCYIHESPGLKLKREREICFLVGKRVTAAYVVKAPVRKTGDLWFESRLWHNFFSQNYHLLQWVYCKIWPAVARAGEAHLTVTAFPTSHICLHSCGSLTCVLGQFTREKSKNSDFSHYKTRTRDPSKDSSYAWTVFHNK